MPNDRFFVDSDLKPGQLVDLEGQELHHLVHVMRAEVGDTIELVNGRGGLADARLERLEKRRVVLHIETGETFPKQSVEIILAQAMPRINRLDFILEKGTELGMTQLWLFPAKLSERQELTPHQLERMRAITIAAMKQCGSLYLPQIIVKPALSQWQPPSYTSFFGDVNPAAPQFATMWKTPDRGVLFYIGPEGGFTAEEEGYLRQLNASGVHLHPNILRTDTASLVALSLISQYLAE